MSPKKNSTTGKSHEGVQKVRKAAPKRAKAQAKSRPASAIASIRPDSFTDQAFSLESFISKVWQCGGYQVDRSCPRTIVASSICTGTNSFGVTLEAMLKCTGVAKMRHLFGSENNKTAQHFILRNTSPCCLFEVLWLPL